MSRNAPEVTVIIPARNEAAFIGGQLQALSRQDFTGAWEVVVGDDGSTDDTLAVVEAWRHRLPSLTIVDASPRRGVNAVRNAAAGEARSGRLLFADADDEVTVSWVSAMVAVLGRSEIATGPVVRFDDHGNDLGVLAADGPLTSLEFLPYALGCNLGVRRETFDRVTGFDDDWPVLGGDEIDFCWRAMRAGAHLGFSRDAVVRYRQPVTLRRAFVKQTGYGQGSVILSKRYRADGARVCTLWDPMVCGASLLRNLPWLLSRSGRMEWVKRMGWATGLAFGLARPTRERPRP